MYQTSKFPQPDDFELSACLIKGSKISGRYLLTIKDIKEKKNTETFCYGRLVGNRLNGKDSWKWLPLWRWTSLPDMPQ